MTVNTTNITSGPYTGNGLGDEFAYGFRIEDASDLKVFQTAAGAETSTLLTLTTDYTVTGVSTLSGTIVLVAGNLETGGKIFIRSDYSPTQLTSFRSQGRFSAAIHEDAFDKAIRLIQQLLEARNRSLLFAEDATATEPTTIAQPIEGYSLVWDTDGNLVNTSNTFDALLSAAAGSASASQVSRLASGVSETNSANSASASQVSRLASGVSATSAQLDAWIAEAEAKTSESYAVEPENVVVKTYSSDGDGTFTATATTDYSALHHAAQADSAVITGTGVTSSYVSSVSVGGTTFNQPAVIGEINSDLIDIAVSYAGATGITVTTLSSASTYVYIDSAGALQQQTTTPTREDWVRKIFTMRIGVDTVAGTILGFEYLNNPIGHYANSIRDLYAFLIAQGIPLKKDQVVTGRAGDLGFDISAGSFMEFGGTGDIYNPNIKAVAAVTNASYTLFSRTAIVSVETNLLKFWDNATTITALGSGTVVGHRLYRFSNGNLAMQYGQGNYANMTLAKSGALLEEYVLNEQLKNATFFGWWFINETAANTGGTTLTEFKEYTIGIQGGSSSGLAGCLLIGNNGSDILDPAAFRANAGIEIAPNIVSRNAVQNQDPVSQGTATRSGMSSTIYSGTSAAQSISTGVDMDTGDLGGLVWVKTRNGVENHVLYDTVRAAGNYIISNSTGAEAPAATTLTSFDTTGFSVGTDTQQFVNLSGKTYAAWSWQTTEKTTGTTNRNKAYTCHYNADLGFSIVGYEGDGVGGHEIPHFLGKEPELSITKGRDTSFDWIVQSSLFADTSDLILLNTSSSLINIDVVSYIPSPTTISIGSNLANNGAANDFIAYNFTSIPNVCKIDRYKGTGAAGNYVDCGFKAAWVLIKNLTTNSVWEIADGSRGDGRIFADSSDAEISGGPVEFVDGGFVLVTNATSANSLNDQFIFMAYAEGTAFDSTKTLTNYPYATTDEVLTINSGTLMSFAEGFSATGQVDTQELVGAGVTLSFGATYEEQTRYVYKDKAGSYDSTQYRPLEGISRAQADKFGLVSPLDAATRTTDKHFGYESATGVVLASSELETINYNSWNAFDKDSFKVISGGNKNTWLASATTGWLQYKFSYPRVLKSWRLRSSNTTTRNPKRFTIEGSNDGFAWTAIDSTYTASDYVGEASLWGDIQDTSANTVAYVYHRINITANNGDAQYVGLTELEFNTITPSDYLNVVDGLVYNNAGTVIDRVYLAKIMTGASGELLNYENLPVAKTKGVDAEYQGKVTVHGDISNRGICTAWVNFDGTTNPPTIRDSYNVADVVDLGAGSYKVVFDTPMDSLGYSAIASNTQQITNYDRVEVANLKISSYELRIKDNTAASRDGSCYSAVFGGKSI
tara:strand:- start:5736 stop:9821 length:4086 start_codon:yes stop_codon:yes gene_type:complete